MKQNPSSLSPRRPPHSEDGQDQRLGGCACSRTTDLIPFHRWFGLNTQQSFRNSFSYAVLPATHPKPVPMRIIFFKSNTPFVKSGSTKVLKDFFLTKGKKHELHSQQFWARVYFLVFTLPESTVFQYYSFLTNSTRNVQLWGALAAKLIRGSSHYTKVLGSVSSQGT